MNNRHIFILTAIFFVTQTLTAQFKVDERSGKTPDWTSGLEKNYIIGIGNGHSLDVARDKAIVNVKSQIVTSVADFISSSTDFYTGEITADKFSQLYQSYTNQIQTQSGKRDYLQGISASRVEDYYWEKLYNKKTKEVKYEYFVKYPFNQFDLDELVRDFNEKDQLLTDEMNNALMMLEEYTSIEGLIECQSLLSKLSEVFIDERKTKCMTGIERCKALLASVYITDAGSELGVTRYSLKIGQKAVRYAKRPVVSSNCARIGDKKLGDYICEIDYHYDECYDDPENNIKVYYSFCNQRPEKLFYFDVAEDKAEISISGNIHFTEGTIDGDKVSNATCIILLRSKFESPVTVTNVTLEWKEYGIIADITLDDIFEGIGHHELRFEIPVDLPVQKISTAINPQNTVNGYLTYKSVNTGKSASIRIYKHDYVTGW